MSRIAVVFFVAIWLAASCDDPYHRAADAGTSVASSSGSSGDSSAGSSGAPTSGGADCTTACPAGCCIGAKCTAQSLQDWTSCGRPGGQCTTCDKGVLCSAGACDNAHFAPNTLLTLTVTRVVCKDPAATPFGKLIFNGASPQKTVVTATCSPSACQPAQNRFEHIQSSWLVDGSTTYEAWDGRTSTNCWSGQPTLDGRPFPAPLPVMSIYDVLVGGYSEPGMQFTLTVE
jgi:hypothetical protein